MAEFKISRLRYTWKGPWTSSEPYNRDDVVRFGGATWVCIRQHTSSSFATDQVFLANPGDTAFSPAWTKMTDGYAFRGTWTQSTLYGPGDLVVYGGYIYVCNTSHTSASTFAANVGNWNTYFANTSWNTSWQTSTRYGLGELVKYGGVVYRCIGEHTSAGSTSNGLEVDQANWTVYYLGYEFKGDFASSTRYKLNDIIKYGGSLLKCTTGHTSSTYITNQNWVTEIPGNNFYQEWNSSIYYAIGDVVKHGGRIYRSNTNNFNSNPSTSVYQPTNNNWSLISKAINLVGDWSQNSSYKAGDLVRRGGYLYVALLDTTADGSSIDYLDSSNWEIVVPSYKWRGSWDEDQIYSLGDLINFKGTCYVCNFEHTSSNQNYPGDNGSGFNYWDIVLLAGSDIGLTTRGDLLTYDLSRSEIGDTSTFGATNIPIGTEDKVLTVNNEGSVYYKIWGNIEKVRYVSSDDTIALDDETDPNRGLNPFKPYRTVRFACEQVEKLGSNGELITIKVLPGYYEEVLPIIIPAKVAVRGEELRSVTIVPKPANPLLTGDATYTKAVLTRIFNIIDFIILGQSFTKTLGNEENPWVPVPVQVQTGTDFFGNPIFVTVSGAGSPATITSVRNLISNIRNYIDFYINSTGSDPALVGSNTAVTAQDYVNTVTILENNKDFLAAEAVAFMQATYPAYNFDPAGCRRDVKRYIDAWKYDIIYTGNYKSLMAGRYYRNAVLGSLTEDMFYCRDATGLRNCTLKNLTGSLNPPAVNELYRRPTGGAFVSLDPGWGPNDNRTWINTRSPYVQNVTTFGYGATGQKIDGSLHNGGNKSIVSNDFTQVISDGIGAWVLNGGRAELVSVFTYYAQIGMFAEDGGIIRATNGNSSYGDFGALADGNDPNETPRYASVNTRTSEATVASAFAGEVNDEILILEFSNAGQEYTNASYTFVGSGTSASVTQEEFRDNGIFELQVKNNPNTPGGTPGGGGWTLVGNNAQTGNTTSITLASNDENSEAQLLGLRLIVTSGDGTGQYGYISAYNSTTKVATIRKESDGNLGWDHVIPGYPIVPLMTTNATYRIEPRLTIDPPPTSFASIDLEITTNWANVVYGETTETYSSIEGSAGTGVTIDVVPVAATWNVVKNGRTYTVTLSTPGAGYEVGQTISIVGSLIGGQDDENDLTIYVTGVSDDSTNSVVSFNWDGIAQSGRFVATPTTGTSGVASINGDDWVDATLPTSGNWKCLAAGSNMFVAAANTSNQAAYSYDGVNWTATTMPSNRSWNAIAYGAPNGNGDELFVAVAGNLNSGAFSQDGITWTATTLPVFGDSTLNIWVDIAYGKNKWVAIANSGNIAAYATWNGTALSWTGTVMDVVDDSSAKDWVSVAYGNNRFVALSSTGDLGYSFDGITWLSGGSMPKPDGSTVMNWKQIRYGQGVFFAVCDTGNAVVFGDPTTGQTDFCATSYDGIIWTGRSSSVVLSWAAVAFGNPDITLGDSTASNSKPMFVLVPSDSSRYAVKCFTGAKALGRVITESGRISQARIWEPGSGYVSQPSFTITDPNNTSDAYIERRIGDGVLAQPTWLNRGTNYKTSNTSVTVTGDGYADVIPVGNLVTLSDLTVLPGPGSQFRFRGEVASYYTVAAIELDSQQPNGTFTAVFRIGPNLTSDYNLEHNTQVEIRERYSQVRITGHDFLDVGTGNFVETNYPELYSAASFVYAPENEVVELNGGRVFYTSTDQSGNFRTGELFAVEQATGIVTISADFFDLQGLTELALGGVRLGGSGAVVREFSTDPLFTADSNNVVPTQRAIKAYLQNRLNVGGSDLLTASFIAGTVLVGPNLINNSASLGIIIPKLAKFSGAGAHISGSILAQNMFHRSFRKR